MPSVGKEIERNIATSVDDLALQEVENYIEKVERSTERTDDSSQKQNTSTPDPQANTPQPYVAYSQTSIVAPKKIILPVSEKDLDYGLKQSSSVGFKWLSEWCVMMIKKYPGRVFYNPSTSTNHD